MSADTLLRGRVVLENGKPLAGVSVRSSGAFWLRQDAKQTDADGRFEIDSLPANVRFQVFKSGYSGLSGVPLRLDAAGLVTVVLQPMGLIRGRVFDAKTGKPLEQFHVWLTRADTPCPPRVPASDTQR